MKINESSQFSNNYTFTKWDDVSLLRLLKDVFKGVFTLEDLRLGKYAKQVLELLKEHSGLAELAISQKTEYHNLVPSLLRNQLAILISGVAVVPTFQANKIALGDDSTLATAADTKLGNETLRADFSDRNAFFNVAYLDKFFGSAEVGGNTYLEAGVFVDGTGVADSGFILSHVNINETMTATESLTINATFTILDS